MLKMSFYNGTLDRAKAKKIITESKKPCKYTRGFKFRSPATCLKPITKKEAMHIIDTEDLLDIDEREDYFDLNSFSTNDMW